MKRFIIILAIFGALLFASNANAKVWRYTGYVDAGSGGTIYHNSTGETDAESSGVSLFTLEGHGHRKSEGITTLTQAEEIEYWSVEVKEIRVTDAQETAGGDYSGVTFTLVAWASNVTNWAQAEPIWMSDVSGVALSSGASAVGQTVSIPMRTNVRFGIFTASGATLIEYAEIAIVGKK